MQHFRSLESLNLADAWVSIGSFDGVHLGHQQVVRDMAAQAHQVGAPAVVITFYPHPAVVLRKIEKPYYLTSPDERAALLGKLGVDFVVTLPFDLQLAGLSAAEFMQMLTEHLGLRSLWVGYDFALGRNRQGDIKTLTAIGQESGYKVHVVEPITNHDVTVSSSLIRSEISLGNVENAAAMLGRWYDISGIVAHGDVRGRDLGFPTANMAIWPERLLPAAGVYATWSWLGSRQLASVTNVGYRPTFVDHAPEPRVEAHILDFDEDIYDQEICLEFVKFLRPEQRFSGIQALLEQIKLDVVQTLEVLLHVS